MVQNYTKDLIVKELKNKLDTDFGIGSLYFSPYNTIELDSVYLLDRQNNQILFADKISTSVDLWSLVNKKLIFTQASLENFDIKLSKENKQSPLNIQFIIEAFRKKDDKPSEKISIQLNSITIKDGRFSYDILDEPENTIKFDPNHIEISNFIAKLSLKSIVKDSLNIQIKRLGFNEKSGFAVSNLVGRLTSNGTSYSIKDFELLLPHSELDFNRLDFSLGNIQDGNTMFNTPITEINLDLNKSSILPYDVKAFLPTIDWTKDKVTISSSMNLKINDLSLNSLDVNFGNGLRFNAYGKVKDWEKEDSSVDMEVKKLSFSGKELQEILNLFSQKHIDLPKGVEELKNISFQGHLKGAFKDLHAFGNLITDNGVVSTRIDAQFDKSKMIFNTLKGNLTTKDFDLGNTLSQRDLNKISLDLSFQLNRIGATYASHLQGKVDNFDFKNYTYQDISFDLNNKNKITDLLLNIDDEYARLNLSTTFNQQNAQNPSLKANLKLDNLEINKTHLSKKWENSSLALNMDLDIQGKDIDKLEGILHIDSISFFHNNEELFINHFDLTAQSINKDISEINLMSDIASGYLKGNYNFKSLPNDLKVLLDKYLINLNLRERKTNVANDLSFSFTINNSEKLSKVLELPVAILDKGTIEGKFDKENQNVYLLLDFPRVFASNNYLKDTKLLLNNDNDQLKLDISSNIINKNKVTNTLAINNVIKDNVIATSITYNNDHKNEIKAKLNVNTSINYDKLLHNYITNINFKESDILVNKQEWSLDNSYITLGANAIKVDGFNVHSVDNSQSLSINGDFSTKKEDSELKVALKSINLEYLFGTLAIDALQFGGFASGMLNVSSVQEKPYITADLNVNEFKFNQTLLGELKLSSFLEQDSNKIILNGDIINEEGNETRIDGIIDPIDQNLSINFDADSINIGFLNKYTESILNEVSGKGSGQVTLHGNFSKVTVNGVANIFDGKVGIKLLDADYTFSDRIYLKDNLIYFNDIKFYDKLGNVAIGSGKVSHDYFSNMVYYIGFNTDNFLVYNASELTNPIFYGVVFGKGTASIHGNEQNINIDVKMETQKGTQVSMNFMDETVTTYSFIKFKDKNPEDDIDEIDEVFNKRDLMKPIDINSEMNVNMDFFITTTPDASFSLIMDPEAGDALRGYGYGDLQFKWDTKNSPELFGIYHVLKGNYNFRFQRLLEKNFKIKEGSTIDFKGDPFKAVLNISAIYELYASLSDLDNSLVQTTGKTNVLTNCILNITGQLEKPNIKLDIGFPKESENIQAQIKSYMNTVDMINKQVTYLLILSKFYTPETSTVDNPSSNWTVMASATLSNQLTNIINQIDKRIQLGTHIRLSDTELTNTEVELLLSSQLLNDRLLINGNFGYRDNPTIERNAVITDIDVEFLLNRTGTWRIKAYNHYNEKFFYLNSDKGVQTQGLGIIYRKDFDNFADLFRRNKKKKKEVIDKPDKE